MFIFLAGGRFAYGQRLDHCILSYCGRNHKRRASCQKETVKDREGIPEDSTTEAAEARGNLAERVRRVRGEEHRLEESETDDRISHLSHRA